MKHPILDTCPEMPLYLENSYILDSFPSHIAGAMLRIKEQMEGKSVKPKFAVQLMRKELHPFLDTEHHDILNDLENPTWEDIHWSYPAMVFRGGASGFVFHHIGKCIITIYEHTSIPPRDVVAADILEVKQFLEMCKFAGREISHNGIIGDDQFDVLVSCMYCWRQPKPKNAVCVTHAGGDKFIPIGIGTKYFDATGRSGSAFRKEAYRQKELFDKILLRNLSDEVWEFHESEFKADILIPETNIWLWLTTRRREVAQLLLDEGLATDDDAIIESLLLLLHSPQNLPTSAHEPFLRTNQAIRNEPILIWPMLLRANSWLAARKELRTNWGGNRTPEKPLSLKSSLTTFVTRAYKFSTSIFARKLSKKPKV